MFRPRLALTALLAIVSSCQSLSLANIVSAVGAISTPPPAGDVRADVFESTALGVRKHVVVYLPPSYGKDTTRRYPVVYYLHGLSGTERDWLSRASIDVAADSLFAHGTPEMIIVLPDGDEAVAALAQDGHAAEFIRDQFRHCKTILAIGAGEQLLAAARIPAAPAKGGDDPGLLRIATAGEAAPKFVAAIARHRHFERQTDPPMV